MCSHQGIQVQEFIGLKPVFSSIPLKNYRSGIVPPSLRFELTPFLGLSYMGWGEKIGDAQT